MVSLFSFSHENCEELKRDTIGNCFPKTVFDSQPYIGISIIRLVYIIGISIKIKRTFTQRKKHVYPTEKPMFNLQLNAYTTAISSVNKIVINEWLRLNFSGFLMYLMIDNHLNELLVLL